MKKFIALVVMLCAVLISSSASAADWVWVLSDEDFTIYVDNNSIRRDYNYSGHVFCAFVKLVYSDAGRQRFIEWYSSSDKPLPRGIHKLSYDLELCYFKLDNNMKYTATLNCVFYNNDGNTILEMNFSHSEPQWDLILPETIAERMFDVIHARVPN